MQNKVIICAGIGASGSSGLYDYFNYFQNTYGISAELKPAIAKGIYSRWAKEGFKNTEKYRNEVSLFFSNKLKDISMDGRTLLLNNVISGINLRGIELFENVKLICTVRDPRSTWVAWQTEWLNRHGNKKWSEEKDPVGRFILSYRNIRHLLLRNLFLLKDHKLDVNIINFEDFVFDSRCRKAQCDFFGLSKEQIDPTSVLRPQYRTVFAHQYFIDQSAIERIQEELKQFCYPGI